MDTITGLLEESMNFIQVTNRRLTIVLLALVVFAGCAATPPRQPTIETVDRDAIKAALKREFNDISPGPPPLAQKDGAPDDGTGSSPNAVYPDA